jgi:hypothetical protein
VGQSASESANTLIIGMKNPSYNRNDYRVAAALSSIWRRIVGLAELESAVARLPADELAAFAQWFEEFLADEWDRQIEADIKAGRLDEAGRRADADFEAGRCEPL